MWLASGLVNKTAAIFRPQLEREDDGRGSFVVPDEQMARLRRNEYYPLCAASAGPSRGNRVRIASCPRPGGPNWIKAQDLQVEFPS